MEILIKNILAITKMDRNNMSAAMSMGKFEIEKFDEQLFSDLISH